VNELCNEITKEHNGKKSPPQKKNESFPATINLQKLDNLLCVTFSVTPASLVGRHEWHQAYKNRCNNP